nr:granulocyte-macrophage colony-stimulating factor receptor subunit alpha-like isoform X2 [Dasypus novemcinctus]
MALLGYIWFFVLLGPACGQEELQQAKENVSPIINMKLDPRKKMITWNYGTNVTEHTCEIDTPDYRASQTPQVGEDNTYFCRFPNSVLHRGAILRVNATSHGETYQETLTFHNSGREGSAAINFSCFIYDIRFMNCSWSIGPAAPTDVQYHLYKWDIWYEEEVECSQYLSNPNGLHVGCHFDKLSEPSQQDNYFFLLTGTSKETAIQFLDFTPFVALTIEKYNPPSNITISYSGSNHIIQWENPKMRFTISSRVLYYELDLQRKGSSRDSVFQNGADANVYLVPSSEAAAENTLRIRVRHRRSTIWSDWSETLCFEPGFRSHRGCDCAGGGDGGAALCGPDIPLQKVPREAKAVPAHTTGERGTG